MRIDRPLSFVLCCLLASLCIFGSNTLARESKTDVGVVAACFDGDTVKLMDRRVIRLIGIDAPEFAHEHAQEQFYAKAAHKTLRTLAQGKKVQIVSQGSETTYHNGCVLADLVLEDGESLSCAMVRAGAAFVYPHKDLNPAFLEKLFALQQEAIKEKVGLWEKLLKSPIAGQSYTGDSTSHRFFPSDCPHAQSIKPRNRVYFGTVMDAFLANFAPARICVFWPSAKSLD